MKECENMLKVRWKIDNDKHRLNLLHDRFTASVWQFGSIWQSVVQIQYPLKVEGKIIERFGSEVKDVRMCLPTSKSWQAARRKAIDWIEMFSFGNASSTPENVMSFALKHYSSIFPNRIDWLNHMFCCSGNGYEWLDGSIYDVMLESDEVMIARDLQYKRQEEKFYKIDKVIAASYKLLGKEHPGLLVKPKIASTKEEWNTLPTIYSFKKINEYCFINTVPDDVDAEWLTVAIETAEMLAKDPENKKEGLEVLNSLRKRFADRLKDV